MQYLVTLIAIVVLFLLTLQSIKETKQLENAVKTKIEIMQRMKTNMRDTVGLYEVEEILKEHDIDLKLCE